MCVCVYKQAYAWTAVPAEARNGTGSSGRRISGSCDPPKVFAHTELHGSPLEEQCVLFTTEPSFSSRITYF